MGFVSVYTMQITNATGISCHQQMKYCDVSYHPEASSSPTLLCPPHLKACAQVSRQPSALRDKLIEVKGNPIHFGHASSPHSPTTHTQLILRWTLIRFPGSSSWAIKPGVEVIGRLAAAAPNSWAPPCWLLSLPLRSSQTLMAAFN